MSGRWLKMHGSDPYKMCIRTFDFCVKYTLMFMAQAHADLKRGFSVSLIVVYSEGMSKVNDICASEVAI